jgi:hypothetical protein
VEGSCEHGDELSGSLKLLWTSWVAAVSQEGLSSVSNMHSTRERNHTVPQTYSLIKLIRGCVITGLWRRLFCLNYSYYITRGLISLRLYKKNQLQDWKNVFTLHIPPWALHAYNFVVLTSLAHQRKILLVVLQIGKANDLSAPLRIRLHAQAISTPETEHSIPTVYERG